MDISKMYEFFQPEKVTSRCHIIGCGSVGSTIVENLVRCGVTKFTFWDFDTVESHNVHNQMFYPKDIGRQKTEALTDMMREINPSLDIKIKEKGWNGEVLSGYVFLCVDNIELRKTIVENNMHNMNVKAVFDFRTLLTSAQHYAADWSDLKQKQILLDTMQFSHEEAAESTPTSACGMTLGVMTTVRLVCAYGVNNFISFVKGEGIKRCVLVDGFNFVVDAF